MLVRNWLGKALVVPAVRWRAAKFNPGPRRNAEALSTMRPKARAVQHQETGIGLFAVIGGRLELSPLRAATADQGPIAPAMSQELKLAAGRAALDYVEDGMRLGIGTGSTAEAFIELLAEKVAAGLSIRGVATSTRTEELCAQSGVPVTDLDNLPELDLTIDGADEVAPDLGLIKGGGGALLREKIVAAASKRMIVIADESKIVDALGAFGLPIEVNRFGLEATKHAIEVVYKEAGLDGVLALREKDGKAFVTDGGHLIVDASFGLIRDAKALSDALLEVPGVVQHGLFLGMAERAIIAGSRGVREITC